MVSGYDVRPETKEQIESLGAKFVDTGVSAAGAGGYARELTDEEKRIQAEQSQRRRGIQDAIRDFEAKQQAKLKQHASPPLALRLRPVG